MSQQPPVNATCDGAALAHSGFDLRQPLFHALANHITDPLILIDMDDTLVPGKIAFVNAAAVKAYGYSVADFLNRSISSLIEGSVMDRVSGRLAWLNTTESVVFETKHQRADGTMFPVEVNARLVIIEGRRYGMAVHRDITGRMLTSQALKESETRFQLFMDHTPAVVFMKDLAGRYIYLNKTFERTFNVTLEQWWGKVDDEVWAPEVAAKLREVDAEVMQSGQQREVIEMIPHADGWHEWLTYKFPLLDADGRPQALCGTAVDVSTLRKIREELRVSREQYRILMEQAADGIVVTDQVGVILDANEALAQIVSVPRDTLLGINVMDLARDFERDRLQQILDRVRAGEQVRETWTVPRPTGDSLVIELNAKCLSDGRFQAIVRDFTEQHHAQERERRQQAELAHVARLSTLGQMLAGIAHEVSQPLYAITNYANACVEVLENPKSETPDHSATVAKQLLDWTKQIAAQSMRAGQVIRRLATFAKKSPVQRENVNPNQMVRDSVELFTSELKRHDIKVELDLESPIAEVTAEPVLIQQVLVNLIRNACEAERGCGRARQQIIVSTRQHDDHVEFAVCDLGTGIAQQVQSQIFDSFFTTKSDGMGLGLAISRSIIEAHAGRLWAENNSQCGATFRFTLPLTKKTE